ncbi:MAG: hypothetical protein Q4C70_14955 [Planctomycetia bacterium]|nr:hypothetical protein [Planctomycetia bacterium]
MATRCDELKLTRLEKDIQKIRCWSSTTKIRKVASQLDARLRVPHTPHRVRFEKLQKQLRKCRCHGWYFDAFLIFLLILGIAAGGAMGFNHHINSYITKIKNPETSLSAQQEMKRRLLGYEKYVPEIFLMPWSGKIGKIIEKIDENTAESFWQPVLDATDLPTKASRAQDYLRHLPNGQYVGEAQKIIDEFKTKLDDGAWELVSDTEDIHEQLKRCRKYLEDFNQEPELPAWKK